MTGQEKIDEMAKVIVDKDKVWELSSCNKCNQEKCNFLCYKYCGISGHCNILYFSGYRKATEVIDELVKNIMTDADAFLSTMSRNLIRMCASKMKKELAYEMRQGVEK